MKRENFVIFNRPISHRVSRRLYDDSYDLHNANHYYLACAIANLVKHVDIDMDDPGFERELLARYRSESGSHRNPQESQVEQLVLAMLAATDRVCEYRKSLSAEEDPHKEEFALKMRYMGLFRIHQSEINVIRVKEGWLIPKKTE